MKYCSTDDRDLRETLYKNLIGPAFNELVEKIVSTYKFNGLPNIDVLKEDCKVFLSTVLQGFDPEKGHKAFSYFTVITRNWFIAQCKKINTSVEREVNIEDVIISEHESLQYENTYEEEREKEEFLELFMEHVLDWKDEAQREHEMRVVRSVEILFENAEDFPLIDSKKAVYQHLRDISGLNTKQVVACLNRIRPKYRQMKRDWDEGCF